MPQGRKSSPKGEREMPEVTERLAYSIDGVRRQLDDISRDTIERLIARGELKSFSIGRRKFVSAQALSDYIRRREEADA